MKTAFLILLLCIYGLPASACTYAEYKRDSAGRAAARAAFKAKDYAKTIVLFNKLLCKEGMAAMDKRNLMAAYDMQGNTAGLAKTLRSIDVRYFAQHGDELATFDLYFGTLPAKYTVYKTEARNRLKAFLDTVRGKPNFEYLRHEYLVDQAIRKNPSHDSLSYYGDWSASQKLQKERQQYKDFYAYVQQYGFPTLGVAGNYPEMLITHNRDRINYYLPLAIASAERGETDWQVVENLEGQKKMIETKREYSKPLASDTIAFHFFNEDCRFVSDNAKRIQDTLLARSKKYRFVKITIAIDSSYIDLNRLSFKYDNVRCQWTYSYTFDSWLEPFLKEKKIFLDYITSYRYLNYYKRVKERFNQTSIFILEYYQLVK